MTSQVDDTMAALAVLGHTGSIQDRLSAYYKSQLNTPPIPWVDPDPTAFTPIVALTENFETGINGTTITTSNTIFENVVAPAGTITTTSPYIGTRSMQIASTANNPAVRADITSAASLWVVFAFKINTLPAANSDIFQAFNANPAVVSTLRISSTGTLNLRDNVTSRATSSALSLNTWYEIHLRITPGTNASFIIYNADGSVFQNVGTSTLAATGNIVDIRLGSISGAVTSSYCFDYIRGDLTREPRHAYWVQPPDTPGTELDTHNMSSADMQIALGYDLVTDMRKVEDL